jgi:hypothetical protein
MMPSLKHSYVTVVAVAVGEQALPVLEKHGRGCYRYTESYLKWRRALQSTDA